jgi:trimethylamine:corrinoid methyltransferase-like protein
MKFPDVGVLNPKEIKNIHFSALKILEEIGFKNRLARGSRRDEKSAGASEEDGAWRGLYSLQGRL